MQWPNKQKPKTTNNANIVVDDGWNRKIDINSIYAPPFLSPTFQKKSRVNTGKSWVETCIYNYIVFIKKMCKIFPLHEKLSKCHVNYYINSVFNHVMIIFRLFWWIIFFGTVTVIIYLISYLNWHNVSTHLPKARQVWGYKRGNHKP
jgi:hypothetical protein